MKLGIFDSGLGGLVIHKAITSYLPQYDTVYLGDTLHVPYGGRSGEAILEYTRDAIDYLFHEQDCQLIIVACNTACTTALQPIQQQYLPNHYPNRRVLGVVIPTLEVCASIGHKRLGLLATQHSVRTNVYETELHKINPDIKLFSSAAPLLVPLIEQNGIKWAKPIIEEYLSPLLKQNIEGLILGCTHYPILKDMIRDMLPTNISLISQDDIIPLKLDSYLLCHPETEKKLSKNGTHTFMVTDFSENYTNIAEALYKRDIRFERCFLTKKQTPHATLEK